MSSINDMHNMQAVAGKVGASSQALSNLYAPYLEAEWGLKNHWYPIFFSNELKPGDVKGHRIAGYDIAVVRPKGADRLYAVSDRCAHRGVKISARPMCLTKDTVTCWYHGYTYDLASGVLETIVASPDDPVIGKARIRTYPVQEKNGIIFVFVGDEDYSPLPPLESDVPPRIAEENKIPGVPDVVPYILGDNVYVRGIRRTGNANWRLAVENGFDPGHLLIHWDNPIVLAQDRQLPLGMKPTSAEAIEVIDIDGGPKGIMNMYGTEHYQPIVENKRVNIKARGTRPMALRTSMYVPGCLLVEHWPVMGVCQYEWYIPIDNKQHEYWEIIVAPCENEEQRAELDFMYENFFEPLGLRDFNNNDLFAREALQDFYENHGGWDKEVLCDMDGVIVGWRRVASRYNRGIAADPRVAKASTATDDELY